MGKVIDLTGNTYGELTVLSFAGLNKRGWALWNCRCSCGVEAQFLANNMKTGVTWSCGHLVYGENMKSNAERQKAFEQNQKEIGSKRLNTFISGAAYDALQRYATKEGISLRQAIERLAVENGGEA